MGDLAILCMIIPKYIGQKHLAEQLRAAETAVRVLVETVGDKIP
jgi:hypothetical protein